MCWSAEASATFATVGFVGTGYLTYKREDKAIWLPLAYFSAMELLQALTYPVINHCDLPQNQLLTLLGIIHICFQPFFLNMMALHFIPAPVRRKISPYVYGACLVGAALFMLRLYPFAWAGACAVGWEPLCADRLCAVSGSWHIAWEAPSNGLSWTLLGYFVPVFLVPILYGAWRCTLYHLLAGPLVAAMLTNNANEWPAVWCLMSVGLILLTYIAPVRRSFYVRHWWLWGDDLNRETDRVGALVNQA